jgi:hypothetical protein
MLASRRCGSFRLNLMTSQTTINAPLNAQGANTNGSRLLSIGSSGSKRPVNNGRVARPARVAALLLCQDWRFRRPRPSGCLFRQKILFLCRKPCRPKFWLALRLQSLSALQRLFNSSSQAFALVGSAWGNHNERYYSEDECASGASRANPSNMAAGNRQHRLRRYGRLDMFFGLWTHQTNRPANLN